MPVKMRLFRVGAKHQPSYRIVVTPALTPRDGSYLDQVGFYNPVTEPATIRIDSEKAIAWLRKGVQPTDRVARLLSSVNIDVSEARRPTASGNAETVGDVEEGIETGDVKASSRGRRAKSATPETAVEATQIAEPVQEVSAEKPARKRTPRKPAVETESE